MSKNYEKLQNGSDIRGVAIAGVPGEEVNLDENTVKDIAKGFLIWLMKKTGKTASELTISIGRDPRLSGEALCNAFLEGIKPYGITLMNCGLATTPAMFMSTAFIGYNCDGAVMVTASHLPYNRNGLKFFSKNGGLEKSDIKEIIAYAQSDDIPVISGEAKEIQTPPLMESYSAYLRKLIMVKLGEGTPLAGLKISVDAGNGAGGFYATKVLAPLGADISSSHFLEPDGNFPNHIPNPENKAAMEAITSAVTEGKCDLGLIFDTDVDRSSAVDEKGRAISRNAIVAMAAALITEESPETTVVTDSITSNELTDFLENDLGMKHLRFKRGYRNVIGKSIELNNAGIDSALAIETSGHAAYRENYFLDDGAYLATRIVVKTAELHKEGKGISELLKNLKEPAESIEIRMALISDNFAVIGDEILEKIKAKAVATKAEGISISLVEPNYEGVRVQFNGEVNGWFLLRKSLHDPIMPLNVESLDKGGCNRILAFVKDWLDNEDSLDTSIL